MLTTMTIVIVVIAFLFFKTVIVVTERENIIIERLGKYHQPNIERRNDYALWLNMFNNNDNLISVKCPGVLAKYRVNSYGLSSKPFLSLKYHWLALVGFGGYNLAMSTALSAFYLSIVVLKKKFPNLYNLIIKKI